MGRAFDRAMAASEAERSYAHGVLIGALTAGGGSWIGYGLGDGPDWLAVVCGVVALILAAWRIVAEQQRIGARRAAAEAGEA